MFYGFLVHVSLRNVGIYLKSTRRNAQKTNINIVNVALLQFCVIYEVCPASVNNWYLTILTTYFLC
jgi:hypothetical protein